MSAATFVFPCIVKAARSFDSDFPAGFRVFLAQSADELRAFYVQHPDATRNSIWQELIEGHDEDVYEYNLLIRGDGSFGPGVGIRKLRQNPVGFGSMAFGRIDNEPVVAANSRTLMSEFGYRGLISFEFKRRTGDGQLYFIEINPRLPAYCALLPDSGVNFAYLAYLDLVAGESQSNAPSPRELYWLSFASDLESFITYMRRGQLTWSKWFRSILRARSFAWWEWRDPLPFLAAAVRLAGKILRRLVRARKPGE